MKNKSIIIGAGEVGKSLYEVLEARYGRLIQIRDKQCNNENTLDSVSFLNICYPYSSSFIEDTKAYIARYKPSIATIIHSTVPVGTTRKCGKTCVHSPIHGKHPNLADGIRTFTKYVGGESSISVYSVRFYLETAGIKTKGVTSPEASELSKILCTTYYGWNIIFAKEVAAICKEMDLPFEEVYTDWNREYNKGYTKLGMEQFVRPVLEAVEGRIGGHCIINNAKLLDSFATKFLKGYDGKPNGVIALFENPQKAKALKWIVSYLAEETFPIEQLNAIAQIIGQFNDCKEAETEIFEFSKKIYEKYNNQGF